MNPNQSAVLGSMVPIFGGSGSGGGGGPTVDHQAPKIIVGNAANGDTLAVCDILDPGNGSGIAAAAFQASVILADIWCRPGKYNFGQPGAPALPVLIPAGCTVRGAGERLTLLIAPGAGDARIFTLDHTASIRDLSFRAEAAAGGAASSLVLTLGNATFADVAFSFAFAGGEGGAALNTAIQLSKVDPNGLAIVRMNKLDISFDTSLGIGNGIGVDYVPLAPNLDTSIVVIAQSVFMSQPSIGWNALLGAVLFLSECAVLDATRYGVNYEGDGVLWVSQTALILSGDAIPFSAPLRSFSRGGVQLQSCSFGVNSAPASIALDLGVPGQQDGRVLVTNCEMNGGSGATTAVLVRATAGAAPTLQMSNCSLEGFSAQCVDLRGGSDHSIVGNTLVGFEEIGFPANVIRNAATGVRIVSNAIKFFCQDPNSLSAAVVIVGQSCTFSENHYEGFGGILVSVAGDDAIVAHNRLETFSAVNASAIDVSDGFFRATITGNRASTSPRFGIPTIRVSGADHVVSGNILTSNNANGVAIQGNRCIALGNRVLGNGASPAVQDYVGTSDLAHNL